MRCMKFLSSLTAFLSGRTAADAASAPAPTDLQLTIVELDPPDGSTLEAGKDVKVIVEWRYSTPKTSVGVWVKPQTPDEAGGSYEGDAGESHPGQGTLLRTVRLHEPGRVDALLLVARDANSHEIYHRRIPVNYTFVASPEQEAQLRDGIGSRITGVRLDPPSPAHLAPGTRVLVHIAYDATSEGGVRPVAIPVTEEAMTYNGAQTHVDGQGELTQHFTVGAPCTVRQVRVELWNEGGAVVDAKLLDVELRYGR